VVLVIDNCFFGIGMGIKFNRRKIFAKFMPKNLKDSNISIVETQKNLNNQSSFSSDLNVKINSNAVERQKKVSNG
jgi:hypothetical protein